MLVNTHTDTYTVVLESSLVMRGIENLGNFHRHKHRRNFHLTRFVLETFISLRSHVIFVSRAKLIYEYMRRRLISKTNYWENY